MKVVTQNHTDPEAEKLNDQLLQANLKLNEITEDLIRKQKELTEYNTVLDEKCNDLKEQLKFRQKLLDDCSDAIEIIDDNCNLIYQNKVSRQQIGDKIGEKCFHALFEKEQECKKCVVDNLNTAHNKQLKLDNTVYNLRVSPIGYEHSGKTVIYRQNISLLIEKEFKIEKLEKRLQNAMAEVATIHADHEKMLKKITLKLQNPVESLSKFVKLISENNKKNIPEILQQMEKDSTALKTILGILASNSGLKINNEHASDNVNSAKISSPKKFKTILHIDDDRNILTLIKRVLTDSKYRIISETNGANTMELALKHNPDLIMLDIMMPDVNGYEVLKKLSTNPTTNKIPVIILSVSDTKAKSLELGASLHITKPMNKDKLIEEMNNLIL